MRVTLRYDRHVDAWSALCENVCLRTSADVAEWKRQLIAEMKAKLGGHPAYFLVDMSGFSVDPSVATEYGEVAREVASKFALGIIRYGDPGRDTLIQVRLQAVVNRFPANIYQDRQAALSALEQLRALRREGSERSIKSAPSR